MLGIDKQGELSELKKKLEEAINSGKVRSPITAAIRDVLAAINYGDHILLDSSLNALFGGLTSRGKGTRLRWVGKIRSWQKKAGFSMRGGILLTATHTEISTISRTYSRPSSMKVLRR